MNETLVLSEVKEIKNETADQEINNIKVVIKTSDMFKDDRIKRDCVELNMGGKPIIDRKTHRQLPPTKSAYRYASCEKRNNISMN